MKLFYNFVFLITNHFHFFILNQFKYKKITTFIYMSYSTNCLFPSNILAKTLTSIDINNTGTITTSKLILTDANIEYNNLVVDKTIGIGNFVNSEGDSFLPNCPLEINIQNEDLISFECVGIIKAPQLNTDAILSKSLSIGYVDDEGITQQTLEIFSNNSNSIAAENIIQSNKGFVCGTCSIKNVTNSDNTISSVVTADKFSGDIDCGNATFSGGMTITSENGNAFEFYNQSASSAGFFLYPNSDTTKVVSIDSGGSVTASQFNGNLNGNALTASTSTSSQTAVSATTSRNMTSAYGLLQSQIDPSGFWNSLNLNVLTSSPDVFVAQDGGIQIMQTGIYSIEFCTIVSNPSGAESQSFAITDGKNTGNSKTLIGGMKYMEIVNGYNAFINCSIPSMNNTTDQTGNNYFQDRYMEFANNNDYATGIIWSTQTPNNASTPLITSFSSTFSIQQANSTIYLNYIINGSEYTGLNILASASYSIRLIHEI
jgi:hypothetical protein